MSDVLITRDGPYPAPYTYTLGAREAFEPTTVEVLVDGSGAGGDFKVVCVIRSPDGKVLARVPTSETVVAGDSAAVTFAPFLRAFSRPGSTALEPEWGQAYRGFVDAAQTVPPFTNVYAQWLHLVRSNDAQPVFDFGTIVSGDDGLTFAAQGMYLCLAAATFAVPDVGQSIHIQPAAFPLNYTEDTGYATTNGTNTTVFDWQLVVPQGVNQIQGVQLRNGTAGAKDVAGVSLAVYYLPNPVQY